ncbi:hypothetical protein VPH35_050654 [Triticum aestivum]
MQFTGKGVSRHHRVHRRTQQGTFPTTETRKRKPHTAAAAKENRGERSGRYELSSRRIAPHRPATPARCPPSSPALPNRVAGGREVRSPDPPPLSSLPSPPPPPPPGPVASHCSIHGRACLPHPSRALSWRSGGGGALGLGDKRGPCGALPPAANLSRRFLPPALTPIRERRSPFRRPNPPPFSSPALSLVRTHAPVAFINPFAAQAIGFVALASVVARRGGVPAAAATVRGMSFGGASSVAAGGKRPFEYGRTHVVRPKGAHKATIVWLHGLGDNGASWSQLLETLPLPNIKWICPTAPTRPVAIFGGFPSTAWFDVADLSEDSPDDVEGLDSSAAHVANLLSTEPADIKLGVGGFSMGAATALYSGTCFAHGKYGNGNPYPVNLSVAVGLSGWLPCARSLKNKIESSQEAAQKASSLPLMLCHGKADDVVLYKHGERSADALKSTGFANVEFKSYSRLGHYTVPEEMDEVVKWLTASLELGSSSST